MEPVASSSGQDAAAASGLHRTAAQLVAGAAAGVTNKTAVAPLERLKVLRQTGGMRAAASAQLSATQMLADIVRRDGVRALYKGNGANCLRVIPVHSLKFALNDTFKEAVVSRRAAAAGATALAAASQSLTFVEKVLAGSLAGTVQIVATYPLDLIRLRLQLAEHTGVHYRGIAHCASSIARTEELRSLYKGMFPTMLAGVPYVGLQMSFYDVLKTELGPHLGGGTLSMLACGSLAGLSAQTISFPMDTVRHRIQADGSGGRPRVYAGTLDCIRTMIKSEGPGAFFKGWGLNAFRALPGAAIQFTAYDTFKHVLGVV